jgi:murein DD-endopeptidase MepM/ murein hydrolase activator NlpD
MTPLVAGRLALFAWSWRRPLLLAAAALLMMPLLMAAMVVQAQHEPTGPLVLPVKGAALTQPFGCSELEMEPWSDACAGHHFHSGVDLAAPAGTPVYAATSGTIAVHRERGGYGLYLLLNHGPRLSTLYGHLEWPLVQPANWSPRDSRSPSWDRPGIAPDRTCTSRSASPACRSIRSRC